MRVLSRNYDETVSLRLDGRSVQIGRPVASKVWVKTQNAGSVPA